MITEHSCVQYKVWISSACVLPTTLSRAGAHLLPEHCSAFTAREVFPSIPTSKSSPPYVITLFSDYPYLFISIIILLSMIIMFVDLGVHYLNGPQPFWHQGPLSWKTIFPQTGGREDGSGGNASAGERQMKLHSLTRCSPPAVLPGS